MVGVLKHLVIAARIVGPALAAPLGRAFARPDLVTLPRNAEGLDVRSSSSLRDGLSVAPDITPENKDPPSYGDGMWHATPTVDPKKDDHASPSVGKSPFVTPGVPPKNTSPPSVTLETLRRINTEQGKPHRTNRILDKDERALHDSQARA